MKKIQAGIMGAAGYTGGELIRILLNHPGTELVFAHSKSNSGKPVSNVHTDLIGDTDLLFTDKISDNIDVLFLCVAHGDAAEIMKKLRFADTVKIIDLSQDFRLKTFAGDFVYGLTELNRDRIRKARHVANPGCFATAIQLALLPLAAAGKLNGELHVHAVTGSTGAGQGLSASSHFSWRNNNVSAYKIFKHQHLAEIGEGLSVLQADFRGDICFIPQRGDFSRGIFASVYLDCDISQQEAEMLYKTYYEDHAFTFLSSSGIDLKQVVNTNKCLLHIEKHGTKLVILSVIDNLLKGASGQAVQNMNLMFGLDETTGLKLKAVAF